MMISRRNFLAAMGTVAAAGVLTACGGSSGSTAASTAASSTAASAAESWGDVKLTMWGAEEDQTMLREMADAFIEQNADKGNVTIEIGVQSESSAKDTVLADPESAADVFAFADDQLNELVNAGALQEVLLNPDDVKSRNLPGSVGAATMNDKLYAYPMTADNGYFLYYDASVLSAEDVQSMDTMLEKAAAAGKKFMIHLLCADGSLRAELLPLQGAQADPGPFCQRQPVPRRAGNDRRLFRPEVFESDQFLRRSYYGLCRFVRSGLSDLQGLL